MIKLLTWTLYAPISAQFNQYKQKIDGQWVTIDPDAPKRWGVNERGFIEAIELYHHKIYAIGMHEFGVAADGTIYDYKATDQKVLTPDETAINSWVPTSLRYAMETYPNIKWSIQLVAFNDPVIRNLLDNKSVQDTLIRQTRRIAELYLAAGYPIAGIECDMERVGMEPGDGEKYRDLLIRIKQEVCRPLGLELRVNLYAMTGANNPHYYAWHSYPLMREADCDEYQLMTYDFTWAGSAPGPSTPTWWLKQVLDWVKQSLPPEKVFIGNAAYGRRWSIHVERGEGRSNSYKNLIQWQNGLFRHNEGARRPDGTFWWNNQPFLPFCGNHDEESHYQVSYLHVYDKFSVNHLETVDNINRGVYNRQPFVTSYFKRQRPIFGGVQAILSSGDKSGEVSESLTVTRNDQGLPETTFQGYTVNSQRFVYNEELKACVPAVVGWDGDKPILSEPGRVRYTFEATGNYKLIALVSFPTYGADRIDITINGTPYTIGGDNLEDWYPFYVLASHYYDCGNWNFSGTNTIEVQRTYGGAVIYGFIVCQSYDQNFTGGVMRCTANIRPMYERDTVQQGVLKKRLADLPDKLTITVETIRREPRPVIIWEDSISPYVNQEIPGRDLTRTPYYRRANPAGYSSGSGDVPYDTGDGIVCVDAVQPVGYSSGEWLIHENGYAYCDNGQLVLDKQFTCNIRAEMRLYFESGYNQAGGIRFKASQRGSSQEGYLFLLDYRDNRVKLIYQNGSSKQTIESVPMSSSLVNAKDEVITVIATIHNGVFYGQVGSNVYIQRSLSTPTAGAYGVYVEGGRMRLYNFSIQTTDRYEPMEKLAVVVDGQRYIFGEVERTVGYDKYGYLMYSGLDPKSTEVEPHPWDLDYRPSPIATVPAWQGNKEIELEFIDAGIWARAVYIGDSEGFSIAWNGDAQALMKTADIIGDYNVKGIGMWTLGQEDTTIFGYLPDADR